MTGGAKAHYGYDPQTGRELWRVEERAQHSASTRPVVGLGMAFFPTGFSKGQLLAVKLPGITDAASPQVLDESHLANDVILGYPADLTFANDVHGLVSRNRVQCAIDGSEPLASARAELSHLSQRKLEKSLSLQSGRALAIAENR